MKRILLAWLAICLGTASAGAASEVSNHYLLGGGDVIRVSVYDHPDLALEAELASDGTLRMPLVGSVALGGLTFSQAETRIAKRLRDGGYVNHPQVNILISQYRSQLVSVIGEVNQPGRYRLEGDTGLVGILAMAGGISSTGGDILYLVRDGVRRVFRLSDLALDGEGDELSNMRLQPNDQIFVPKQAMFYVYGEVQRPGAYPLEKGMTVMKALALAGGFTGKADSDDIEIQRADDGAKMRRTKAGLATPVKSDDVVFVDESLF